MRIESKRLAVDRHRLRILVVGKIRQIALVVADGHDVFVSLGRPGPVNTQMELTVR